MRVCVCVCVSVCVCVCVCVCNVRIYARIFVDVPCGHARDLRAKIRICVQRHACGLSRAHWHVRTRMQT